MPTPTWLAMLSQIQSSGARGVVDLLGICFHARRTGDGQKGERRRGVRGSDGPRVSRVVSRGTRVPPEAQYTITSTVACSTDFTTSSNLRSFVWASFSLAATSGTDSRKLRR